MEAHQAQIQEGDDDVCSAAGDGHGIGARITDCSPAFASEQTDGLQIEPFFKGRDGSAALDGQNGIESTAMCLESMSAGAAEVMGVGQERKRAMVGGADCATSRMVKAKLVEDGSESLGGEEETEASVKPDKGPACGWRSLRRKKIAMLIAYCGAGYQGMQKNPGAVTIEGLLEEALFRAGAISESNYGDPRKVDWMRAARTDKGVSAVGQVVSGLFHIDPPGFVERVNSFLSAEIRVLGYKRVVPSFNAKKYCDRRRYEYVVPIFAFDPHAHRDRESVLASEGKDGALMRCLECSERGRKVQGAVGKGWAAPVKSSDAADGAASLSMETGQGIPSDSGTFRRCFGIEAAGSANTVSNAENTIEQVSAMNRNVAQVSHQVGASTDGEEFGVDDRLGNISANLLDRSEENDKAKTIDVSLGEKRGVSGFQFGEADHSRFNRILSHYVGTHNFHNFTTRIKPEDPSAKRYIISFEASEPFAVCDMEFVRCTVVGQSFMLHQIRKMLGLAIAIFRNCAPESMLIAALQRDVHVNVPTAPELGLFLDECMYPVYNQKWASLHGDISQRGYEDVINQFKYEYIYAHIAKSESKDGVMALFLHSLNDRNFPDFVTVRNAETLQVENQNAACIRDSVP